MSQIITTVTNTTDYGLTGLKQIIWDTNFRASRDDSNKWTGSESFHCRKEDLTLVVPQQGAPCQYPGWGFMTVNGVEVENMEGGFARVNVDFSGVGNEGDFTFDDDDAAAQEPEFNKYTYDLSITASTEPIETHPKFRDLTKKDREIIFNIIKGNLERSRKEEAGELSEPYTFYPIDIEQNADAKTVVGEDAKKLVDYLMNGVTSFRRARQIWRCNYLSPTLPSANILNYVGFITSAKGAPAVADERNWLFSGINAQFRDGVCETSLEWELSETGGFDTYLYTKPA